MEWMQESIVCLSECMNLFLVCHLWRIADMVCSCCWILSRISEIFLDKESQFPLRTATYNKCTIDRCCRGGQVLVCGKKFFLMIEAIFHLVHINVLSLIIVVLFKFSFPAHIIFCLLCCIWANVTYSDFISYSHV